MLKEMIQKILNREPKQVYGIIHKYQTKDVDCGQTCLDMLEYAGHDMFPDNYLSQEQLSSIPNVKYLGPIDDNDGVRLEDFYFVKPHILEITYGTGYQYHWALAFKNRIFCPSKGILDFKKYEEISIWRIEAYMVPFNRDHKTQNFPITKVL